MYSYAACVLLATSCALVCVCVNICMCLCITPSWGKVFHLGSASDVFVWAAPNLISWLFFLALWIQSCWYLLNVSPLYHLSYFTFFFLPPPLLPFFVLLHWVKRKVCTHTPLKTQINFFDHSIFTFICLYVFERQRQTWKVILHCGEMDEREKIKRKKKVLEAIWIVVSEIVTFNGVMLFPFWFRSTILQYFFPPILTYDPSPNYSSSKITNVS